MKGTGPDTMMRAEAAAWLARLRSDERNSADDSGFRAWLRVDARHQQAFDQVNTAFEAAGGDLAGLAAMPIPPRAGRRTDRRAVIGVYAVAASLAVVIAGVLFMPARPQCFSTGLGEQKRVVLADGSTMLLDTSTTAEVSLRAHKRTVRLVRGRAHLEVAHDTARPFVVMLGKRQVTDVGTVFDVQMQGDVSSVLLSSGEVVVDDGPARRKMAPGDRLVFRQDTTVADKPDLEISTAWQIGRTVFDKRSLQDVVAELNRYSKRQLVIADPSIASMELSGSYRLGDTEGFATSVSALLPVDARQTPDRIILSARDVPRSQN